MRNIYKYFFYNLVLVIIIFLPLNSFCRSNDAPKLNVKIHKQISWEEWINQIKFEKKKY